MKATMQENPGGENAVHAFSKAAWLDDDGGLLSLMATQFALECFPLVGMFMSTVYSSFL